MKVSVVVTSYNYEQYIRRTLDSIVGQTYKDFEVIIVDDGSKDNSIEIIKEFTSKYPNFYLYTHENNQNKGLIESIKLGISKCKGDYIAFLESDDYWSEEYLKEKIDIITNDPKAILVINNVKTFGGDFCDEYVYYNMNYYKNNKDKKNHFNAFYKLNGITTFSVVMIKTNVLKSLDFDSPIPAWLDWWLWRQVAVKYPIIYIDKILTYWNRHDNSYISRDEKENLRKLSGFKKLSNKLLLKKYMLYYLKFKLKRGIKKIISNIFSIRNDEGRRHKVVTICGAKLAIKRNSKYQKGSYKEAYHDYSLITSTIRSEQFKERSTSDNKIVNNNNTKLIAFYLPQYHTFKENEQWHGRGFTEWTNVTKAQPFFVNHFQPQLPIDVGFYDLSTDKIMYRQIELAKQYGVYGFCFHYYWFSGKRLMEQPIFNYLNNKELDFPFCLCWANENWSRKWDASNNDVLMEQKLQKDDWKKFLEDIVPFLQDERYIKVDNKPMLIIYRPSLFDRELFLDFLTNIRKEVKRYGIEDLHLVMAITHNDKNVPSAYSMDAAVEFPPHNMKQAQELPQTSYINPKFKGVILDMERYIAEKNYLFPVEYVLYKTVFPNWDNTARRKYESHICQLTPALYKQWLKDCIEWTKQNLKENEQFVFINAWNEWGEGAHLEPDQRYGFAYLQATKDALEE